jgi:lipoprotein-anchoring transpeptidase ErfK/SrfK
MSLRSFRRFARTSALAGSLASVLALLALGACTDRRDLPLSASGAGSDASSEASVAALPGSPSKPPSDAGIAARDAGYVGPYLYALFMQTPIMSDMEWPLPEGSSRRDPLREGVKRIGYMRRGGKVPVIPEAHKKPNCLEGWYELVSGGFVCGKYATLDANHPRVKLAPHLPFMDSALPYQYGYNLTHGAPLYRTIPSRGERLAYEPWLSAKAKKRTIEESNPYETLDAGSVAIGTPTASALVPANGTASVAGDLFQSSVRAPGLTGASATDPLGAGLDPQDSGIPWYLQDHDGGKPQVTLDELRGEGPIVRRMVRGFYLALDRQMKIENGTKWWKNTEGFVVPFDRVYVNDKVTTFHGVWMADAALPGPPMAAPPPPQPIFADAGISRLEDGGWADPSVRVPTKLPIAFLLWRGRKYSPNADGTKMVAAKETLPRFTAVGLTGKKTRTGGFIYHEAEDGFWIRQSEGRIASASPMPKELKPGEKWVDVDLTTQTLVAYEGDKPVFATIVSTGKKDKVNKEKNHETKPGTFRIREKHIAATMDGDVVSDGPYSIEDVPWIMYFNGSIALHGAFWHNNFGNTRSHGCVNLAPNDARTLFFWTEPSMPVGWHGVWSSGDKPGTLVVVRGETK